MEKSNIHIYINNFIAFLIFSVLNLFLRKREYEYSKSILFINSGQIGDLLVSSILLENEDHFDNFNSLYFLIKDEYLELFENYKGRFKIIGYNPYLYKYFIPYKLKLLFFLRKKNFYKCINLTSARGIINDELSILAGAKEVFCLNSNWKYLKKLFGERMERHYTGILSKNKFNEYDKHIELLKIFKNNNAISFNSNFLFSIEGIKLNYVDRSDILIAPFSSVGNRDWSIENYKRLISLFNKDLKIILLGNKKQKLDLELIANRLENVEVFAGKIKISEIALFMMKTRIFIGNDSGLSHIALKQGIPMIVILGGGQYGRFLPYKFYNSNQQFFLSYPLDCYGCEWRCILKEKECITKITVEDVFNLALMLMNKVA